MQLGQIGINDTVEAKGLVEGKVITGEPVKIEQKMTKEPLRNVSVQHPIYQKEDLKEKTLTQKLEERLAQGTDATLLHNQMAVYAQTTSGKDYAKMQEDGFSPMDMEAHTIVTVTDRIKVAMAKGGADISKMGGLSDAKLEAMSGSEGQKVQLERALEDADLPVEEDTITSGQIALTKTEEMKGELSLGAACYMLKNELSPTIDHVYQAYFSGGMEEIQADQIEALPQDLQKQLETKLSEAGLETSEKNLKYCNYLIKNEIPVTTENLTYLTKLLELPLDQVGDTTFEQIADAVTEGKQPGEAVLLPEYSLMGQAKDAYAQQMKELDAITNTRQMQEARLLMSVEANYALLKKGMAIDTMSIEETVEALKSLEKEYTAQMLQVEDAAKTEQNVTIYQEYQEAQAVLRNAPAAFLAQIPAVENMTLRQVSQEAGQMTAAYQKAESRYETVWTEPRKDLGDRIQKAFSNIDAILEDQAMEPTEENRRAVRILAYNEMELTEENIREVRKTDMAVQRMFHAMKPATVLEMIKEGHNPLDLTVKNLTDMAENMSKENGAQTKKDSDSYAKFLWKLEQTGDITQEQRDSFIGIYRMIYQVEAGDGAAIGALMMQQKDVTLRNLMTAVRSSKHSGQEYTIDDSFGEVASFERSSLSIMEQAEMAFQASCLYAAKDTMTPVKMKQFDSEEAYMDLTPEQFKSQLDILEEYRQVDPKSLSAKDAAYVEEEERIQQAEEEQTRQQVAKALESEEKVYQLLEQYDLPKTPAFLQGISEMLRNQNAVYRKLLKYSSEQTGDENQINITDMIEDLIEEYGEACKTPKEMAEAQHRLEETAEKVMKNMLVEKDVTSIDVRGMKLVMTQIQALGKMGEQSETYNIPILVEDKLGNLSLKIVRGTEEKGLVDVALQMDESGVISGSFRYEHGEITGDVDFEKPEIAGLFSEHMPYFANAMREATGLPVSFRYGTDASIAVDDFYEEKDVDFAVTKEQDPIATKVLYGIARSFVEEMGELLS